MGMDQFSGTWFYGYLAGISLPGTEILLQAGVVENIAEIYFIEFWWRPADYIVIPYLFYHLLVSILTYE